MDFVDEQDQGLKAEKIDASWLRKTALNFEKKITKNAELRAKFEGEPQKFMGSEADLDESVKALSILSEHPDLYSEFARLGCLNSLVSLLSHENTDVAIDAIQIIDELTDEDVDASQPQWDALVSALLEADLLNLLHQNSCRLDESLESDRTGIYHMLGILESLSSNSVHATTISAHPDLLPWLLTRSLATEPSVTQNKQYATEILAILLQTSPQATTRFLDLEGTDTYLQALAPYRKRDPTRGTEEEEFVENLFACLTCAVDTRTGKTSFLKAEGPELCLIMIREGKAKLSRPRALRLLDHLLSSSNSNSSSSSGSSSSGSSGPEASQAASHLIEAAALKPLFSTFMKKQDASSTEHLLGIFASLLRHLPAESAPRIRLLGKFIEKDYEKIARLLHLRTEYAARVGAVDREIAAERKALEARGEEVDEDVTDAWLSRRLDGGLFALQAADVCLAWLVAEDDGAAGRIRSGLEGNGGLGVVRRTLEGWVRDIEEGEKAKASGEGGGGGEESEVREMLGTLIGFLR